jgi:hypothetical protein
MLQLKAIMVLNNKFEVIVKNSKMRDLVKDDETLLGMVIVSLNKMARHLLEQSSVVNEKSNNAWKPPVPS